MLGSWRRVLSSGRADQRERSPPRTPRKSERIRAKDVYVSEKYFDLKLEQIDSDEGHLLVSKFSFSASHPKN